MTINIFYYVTVKKAMAESKLKRQREKYALSKPKPELPSNNTAEKLEVRKLNQTAAHSVLEERKSHKSSMVRLNDRMTKAISEQGDLKANMIKFNTFVREKQLKAERGIKVEDKERRAVAEATQEISEKEALVDQLEKVKASVLVIIYLPGGYCTYRRPRKQNR